MILYFILSTFIHWNSIRNNCSFPPLIYSTIYISKDSFIYQPYSTLWVIIQYYGYVFLKLFQLWSLGDLSSWLWSKSWFEIWKGVKCWRLVLPHRECGHGVLIIILRVLQVLKWEVSSGHWASLICDKSRKPYTDLGIEKRWGHLRGQFQVGRPQVYIYSSFFMGKTDRRNFSLIYKKKSTKGKTSVPLGYIQGPAEQPNSRERERILVAQGLLFSQIRSQLPFLLRSLNCLLSNLVGILWSNLSWQKILPKICQALG